MNLDDLRAAHVDERETDDLRPLESSFYRDAAAYLEELRRERRRAADGAADPFDSETVRRLTDEIETAEEVVEAIYDRRVGKVVKRASFAAAGMRVDESAFTAEEAALFEALVDRIESSRHEVLSAVSGADSRPGGPPADDLPEGGNSPPADAARQDREPDGDGTAEPPAEPAAEGSEAPEGADDDEAVGAAIERTTVRITEDVGEVFGVDERTYDLAAEDVVSLPTANAKPLIDRDAATPID